MLGFRRGSSRASSRILHVLKYAEPSFSGEAVFTNRLTKSLLHSYPNTQHDLLATHVSSADAADPDITNGIDQRFYLGINDAAGMTSVFRLIGWFLKHHSRYDTIHFHTHIDRTCLVYWLSKLVGKRIIYTATLDDSAAGILRHYKSRYRWWVRQALRCFDQFVCISPKLVDETLGIVEADRVSLIPIGIPLSTVGQADALATRTAVRESLGISDDALIVLNVGAICHRKAQIDAVDASFGELAVQQDVHLVLVGPADDDTYVAAVQERAASYGKASHVYIVGRKADVAPYYLASDMFVLPSRNEGFGTVTIEAMSHGLPVIVRHLAGVNDEFVRAGETGLNYQDQESFERLVAKLLADPDLRRQLGQNAQEFIRSRYGLDRISRKYAAIYGLLESESSPSAS